MLPTAGVTSLTDWNGLTIPDPQNDAELAMIRDLDAKNTAVATGDQDWA